MDSYMCMDLKLNNFMNLFNYIVFFKLYFNDNWFITIYQKHNNFFLKINLYKVLKFYKRIIEIIATILFRLYSINLYICLVKKINFIDIRFKFSMTDMYFGIDFGDNYTVISHNNSERVQIYNSNGSRLIPSIVFFGDDRRYFGEQAKNFRTQNLSKYITHIKSLVGLPYKSRQRELISSYTWMELVDVGGYTGVSVDMYGQKVTIMPEQIVAFFLKSILPGECLICISVPCYWNSDRRVKLRDAIEITGNKCCSICNDVTAAAVNYMIEKGNKMPKSGQAPLKALFISIGEGSCTVSAIGMKLLDITVYSVATSTDLSGIVINMDFINHMAARIKSEKNKDPLKDLRTYIRFRDECERVKKVLSTIPQTKLEVTIDDDDISMNVSRNELETLIKSRKDILKSLIKKVLQDAVLTESMIDFVEIIGSSTRIPLIRQEILDITGLEPRQSMNADECVALGCGYLFKSFNLVDRTVDEYTVSCNGNLYSLFKPCTQFPAKCDISFNEIKDAKQLIIYNDNNEMAKIDIIKQGRNDFLVISIGKNGILQASATEKTQITFTDGSFTKDIIEKFKSEEKELSDRDAMDIKVENIKNELETEINNVKCVVCGTKNPPEGLKKTYDEISKWFYDNENEKLPFSDYSKRLGLLREKKNV